MNNTILSTSLLTFVLPLRFLTLLCILPWSSEVRSDVVTFGSGTNTFDLTFKAILNPGNLDDSTPLSVDGITRVGGVNYAFGMSKYEISERMIDIYNLDSRNALTPITYTSPGPGYGANKAATNITWVEAARFVNWLNISQGFAPAYWFRRADSTNITPWQSSQGSDYDPLNQFRSKRTVFALASIDEWYKAAYYDPTLNGSGGYWQYAVRSNASPTAVTSGTGATDVVYGQGANGAPADITMAGGLSAYGVMGMNGNVWEWTESPFNGVYTNAQVNRFLVGGSWADMQASAFAKSQTANYSPSTNIPQGGFRVISLTHFNGGDDDGSLAPLSNVPEPASGVVLLLMAATGYGRMIRHRNRRLRQQK